MLEGEGFKVIDLGVDVPPQKFVEAVKDFKLRVVMISALLTSVFDSIKKTVEALNKAGLREEIKIAIGGGMIDERVREYVGADAFGKDATDAVSLAKKWIEDE